jgi:hypothetical protein
VEKINENGTHHLVPTKLRTIIESDIYKYDDPPELKNSYLNGTRRGINRKVTLSKQDKLQGRRHKLETLV